MAPIKDEDIPTENSYFLNADAQAILEEAPDLESGLDMLSSAYQSETWSNPEEAAKITSDYAQQLRYRFEENPAYSGDEVAKLAPIDMQEIEPDGENDYDRNIDQITKWEQANLDFLSTTTDPDYLVSKDKLSRNIEQYASNLRREAHGKDQGWLSDKFYRFAQGLTAGPANAIGAEDYTKWLKEKTDPSRDDDFSSDLAAGAGTVGGIVGSTLAAGPAGTYGYLGATGVGAVRERYNESIEATGDQNRALKAAAIETGAQLVMAIPGERVFGRTVARLTGRETSALTESAAKRIFTHGATAGGSMAAGGIVSNLAQEEGLNKDIDPFTNVGRSFAVGAIFGSASGALDVWSSKRNLGQATKTDNTIPDLNKPEEPVSVNVVGGVVEPKPESIGAVNQADTHSQRDTGPIDMKEPKNEAADFITADGNRYTFTDTGATKRTKVSSGENFQPFDKTFFVDKATAEKLAYLRDEEGPDGTPINILTDGEKLYVKSNYVGTDLDLKETATGSRLVPVGTLDSISIGAYPVEVNRPRNQNGNLREYRSHIGREIKEVSPKSVGALSLEATKERQLARKVYDAEGTDPALKERLGIGEGDDATIFSRYWPITNKETVDAADTIIQEKGVPYALAKIMESPDTDSSPETVALGYKLLDQNSKALKQAREEGDLDAVNRLADLGANLWEAVYRKSTNTAQTLQAHNIFKQLDPTMRVIALRNEVTRSAVTEAAAELGVTPKELAKTDVELRNLDTEITATQDIITKEDELSRKAVEGEYDTEIQDTGKLLTEIDKAGKERLQEFTSRKKGEIADLEAQAEGIENTKLVESESQIRELQEALNIAENRLAEIEAEAEQRIADQKRAIEEADNKVKELESRVTPETKKSALSQIEKLKEKAEKAKAKKKEDLISPSEKKEIERLNNLLREGKQKIDRLKSTRGLSDSDRAKISKLRDAARDKKLDLEKSTSDSFLSSSELKKKEALTRRREELRNEKARDQKERKPRKSALSEASEQKLKDLLGKKEKLSARKKKVEEKKAEKLKDLGPKAEKLEKLFETGKSLSGKRQQDVLREAFKLEDEIKKKVIKDYKPNFLYSIFQASILSGPPTQEKNGFGNLTSIIGRISALYTSNPARGDALELLKGISNGLTGAGKEAFILELQGKQTFKPEFGKEELTPEKIKRPFEKRHDLVTDAPAFAQKRLFGIPHLQLSNLGYVFRALSANDALFYMGAMEGQARVAAYDAYYKKGLRGSELKEAVAKAVYDSPAAWNDAHAQAVREAELLNNVGIKVSERENRLRAWEILDEKRAPEIREEAHRFAREATFTNKPQGILGQVANAMNFVNNLKFSFRGKDYRPLRYLQPFVNVPMNILNAYIDFVPAAGYLNRKIAHEPLNRFQERNVIGKQIIGSIATGTLYGLMMSSLDEKDPFFTIYGDGPDDYQLKKQLQSEGWKPRSIKIGNTYWSWENTGLDLITGALGAYGDQYRWSPQFDKKTGADFASFIIAKSLKSFTNNTFLKGLGDLIKVATGEDNTDWRNIPTNVARGLVPGAGFLHEVSRWIDNPIETKQDLYAKFISGVPLAQNIGTRPALSAFGEELDGDLEQRLGVLSTFYSDRVTDPAWRFLAESGYNLPDDGGITSPLFKDEKSNPRVAKDRTQKYGDAYFNVLTPDEKWQYVKESGPLIKDIVLKYQKQFGGAGYQESIQKRLDQEVQAVRRTTRQRLFLR